MSDRLDDAKGIIEFYKHSQDMQACSSLPLGTLRWLVSEVERLERELAEARQACDIYNNACAKALDQRDAFEQQANGLFAEANSIRAEVEAAFRAGWHEAQRIKGGSEGRGPDAAWSRYQQERGKG